MGKGLKFWFVVLLKTSFYFFLALAITVAYHNIEYAFHIVRNYHRAVYRIPRKYRKFVLASCNKSNIPITVFSSLIYQETRWRENVHNRNTDGTLDVGLCQINSINWYRFRAYFKDRKFNPYNWRHSVHASVSFLRYLNKRFKGDWYLTVMAYNCGPWRVQNNKIPASTYLYARRIFSAI